MGCPVYNNPSEYQDCVSSLSSLSSSSTTMGEKYDWATWRMYNRITTARRNRSTINPHADATSAVIIDAEMNVNESTGINMYRDVQQNDRNDYCFQSEDDNWSGGEEDSCYESCSGIFLLDMETSC